MNFGPSEPKWPPVLSSKYICHHTLQVEHGAFQLLVPGSPLEAVNNKGQVRSGLKRFITGLCEIHWCFATFISAKGKS